MKLYCCWKHKSIGPLENSLNVSGKVEDVYTPRLNISVPDLHSRETLVHVNMGMGTTQLIAPSVYNGETQPK